MPTTQKNVASVEKTLNRTREKKLSRSTGKHAKNSFGLCCFRPAQTYSYKTKSMYPMPLALSDIFGGKFLEFCERKAKSRERLKLGLTGAFAATRSAGRAFKDLTGILDMGLLNFAVRSIQYLFPLPLDSAAQLGIRALNREREEIGRAIRRIQVTYCTLFPTFFWVKSSICKRYSAASTTF